MVSRGMASKPDVRTVRSEERMGYVGNADEAATHSLFSSRHQAQTAKQPAISASAAIG